MTQARNKKRTSGQILEAFFSQELANPYAERSLARDGLGALDVDADWFEQELSAAIEAGQTRHTARLLVAFYRARLRKNMPQKLVPPVQKLIETIPHHRDCYAVATAAKNCEDELKQLVGNSASMRQTRGTIWAACFGGSLDLALRRLSLIRKQAVLIIGERGTGKERVARAVQLGTVPAPNHPGKNVSINAAAIPETLLERELFGHVKGAYTGADKDQHGKLKEADGFVFFFDEVGDLPRALQPKLLRVIEEGSFFQLGGTVPIHVDVRYVAATNRDLGEMINEKNFRADLFDRFAGCEVHVPLLRERREDIPVIARNHLEQHVAEDEIAETWGPISDWLNSKAVRGYDWPGNVRELLNAVTNRLLGVAWELRSSRPALLSSDGVPSAVVKGTANKKELMGWYVQHVTNQQEGNKSKAAMVLGVARTTLDGYLPPSGSGNSKGRRTKE